MVISSKMKILSAYMQINILFKLSGADAVSGIRAFYSFEWLSVCGRPPILAADTFLFCSAVCGERFV
jgi:hypothetical protein